MSAIAYVRNLLMAGHKRRRHQLELKAAFHAIEGFPSDLPQRKANLPTSLIISLTSYPKRYPTLSLTIKSLLEQRVLCDKIILWVTASDLEALPDDVLRLRSRLFEIRSYRVDIRSFRKLIPTLEAFPDAFIVTADDDVYYPPDWLAKLVGTFNPSNPTIVCHRAHLARFDAAGAAKSYYDWQYDTRSAAPGRPDAAIFPTGVGGVLYPPSCFSPEVLNQQAFLELCPYADDVWFFWMARLARTRHVKVKDYFSVVEWPETQASALFHHNVAAKGNDSQIAAVQARYGNVGILDVEKQTTS